MSKGPVISFVKQIEHLNKSPEKTTPSPLVYKNLEAWKHTSLPAATRVTHTIKQKDLRRTFMDESVNTANETPAAKYPIIDVVSE